MNKFRFSGLTFSISASLLLADASFVCTKDLEIEILILAPTYCGSLSKELDRHSDRDHTADPDSVNHKGFRTVILSDHVLLRNRYGRLTSGRQLLKISLPNDLF